MRARHVSTLVICNHSNGSSDSNNSNTSNLCSSSNTSNNSNNTTDSNDLRKVDPGKIADLSIGLPDTLAYYSPEASPESSA